MRLKKDRRAKTALHKAPKPASTLAKHKFRTKISRKQKEKSKSHASQLAIFNKLLGQDAKDVEIKDDVEDERNGQEAEGDESKDVDFAADDFEVFHQFLLLKGIAVGGFADHLQLIFDALE